MSYIVRGLDPARFRPLFALPGEELARRGIVRMRVDKKPGFPCRVSLSDRDPGETVLLLNHSSHDVTNPYRASHAIFVADVDQAAQYIDCVPPVFEGRVLSLRAFDADGMMADALITEAGATDAGIRELFDNPAIKAIHAHNAARGCFSAKIERN